MRRLGLVALLLHGSALNAHAAVRDRATRNGVYPDPDNPGLICKDFTIGGVTGSSCSNF